MALLGLGDVESAVLYEALAYDIIRNQDGEVVRVFQGLDPTVIDEMELWQIAAVMGELRQAPLAPAPPPDWEDRVARYEEIRKRKESRKSSGE